MSKKIGDVSRRRRFSDPSRMKWYSRWRCIRFARRFGWPVSLPGGPGQASPEAHPHSR